MARVDPAVARVSGRTTGSHFWKHFLAAGGLLALGITQLQDPEAPVEPGWLAGAAPWLIFLAGLIVARALAVLVFGTRWWVTQDRVVQSVGVISRHTAEIDIQQLRGVEVEQSRMGRFLNFGSVRLSGEGERRLVLSGIRGPAAVAAAIRNLVRRHVDPPSDPAAPPREGGQGATGGGPRP